MAHSASINAHIVLHKYRQVSFFSRHYSLHPPSLFSYSFFYSLTFSFILSRLLVAHPPTLKSMTPSVLVQCSALFSSSSSSDWEPTAAARLEDVEKGHALGHRHDVSSRRYKYTAHVWMCVYSLRDYEELHLCLWVGMCVCGFGCMCVCMSVCWAAGSSFLIFVPCGNLSLYWLALNEARWSLWWFCARKRNLCLLDFFFWSLGLCFPDPPAAKREQNTNFSQQHFFCSRTWN